jgi:DNA-binding NarL/FixJ family response regulator
MEPADVPAPVTCLLADDHPEILDFLTAILRDERVDVVGRAANGAHALDLIAQRRPGVALIDLRLPDMSGIEVVRTAAVAASTTACLVYSGNAEWPEVREALDAGARGVILKESPIADVARAIRVVAGGGFYIDPSFGAALATSAAGAACR